MIVFEHQAGADGYAHFGIVLSDLFGETGAEEPLQLVVVAKLDIGQIGFADGGAKHGGDLLAAAFVACDVADAVTFECQSEQFFCGYRCDVIGMGQDDLSVGTKVITKDSRLLYQWNDGEKIQVKIGWPEMKDIDTGEQIEGFFGKMDPGNRADARRFVGAYTAKIDHLFKTGGRDGFCIFGAYAADPLFPGICIIFWRDHDIGGIRAFKGSGEKFHVFHRTDGGCGAKGGDFRGSCVAARDNSDILTFGYQLLSKGFGDISQGPQKYIFHDLFDLIQQSYTFTVYFDSTYPKVSVMAAIKESSTQQINKRIVLGACPVTYTLEKIGGKWKPLILYQLMAGTKRYGELRKAVPGITEKMLIQHLRELEKDGLVLRDVKPVVPPHVEYRLSENGNTLTPILNAMAEWGLARNGSAG